MISALLIIGISNSLSAQCDLLELDTITMYFKAKTNNVNAVIKNNGSLYIIYPIISISIDTNVYIVTNTYAVPSYLNSAGGLNNGINPVFFHSELLMPYDNIPEGAIVKGVMINY